MDTMSRFVKKYEVSEFGDCWNWLGSCNNMGYGQFWNGIRMVSSHRFSYEYYKGPIPEGLELDHLCHTRCCVNPNHLEAVTRSVNTQRGNLSIWASHHIRLVNDSYGGSAAGSFHRRKTHCPQGHPYSEDNTYVFKTKTGYGRQCRTCTKTRHYLRKVK